MKIKRGQIYYIRDEETTGSEQHGARPAVIVGNNIGNETSPVVMVVYLTAARKRWMPTHVQIRCKKPSIALCEQVFTIDKSRIGKYIKSVTEKELMEIDEALAISLGLQKGVPHGLCKMRG